MAQTIVNDRERSSKMPCMSRRELDRSPHVITVAGREIPISAEHTLEQVEAIRTLVIEKLEQQAKDAGRQAR